MTQQGLAVAAGLSVSFVGKLEAEKVDPTWSTVIRLARALGVGVAATPTLTPGAADMTHSHSERVKGGAALLRN
jgi:DNA-binding XRE family transcriptional regulator